MSTNLLNGQAVDLTARAAPPRGRHNGDAGRSPGDGVLRDTGGTRGRLLEAAMRAIDALEKQNRRLRKESASLAESLAKARRFAYHDELTGLPNRRLLFDNFSEAVSRAKRQRNRLVLLFLDLDDFRGINDAVGHVAADRLLQQVALRLTACIRGSDTPCRYGGDELVVLLTDIHTRADAIAVTEKIRAELATPYDIDGTSVRMTASIGMATWPVDGRDCLALIKAADMAMYREKRGQALPDARTAPTVFEQAIVAWRQTNRITG